jgi:hypothetical protein
MITESKYGYYYIMLDASEASDLRHLLHPDGEHIWIHSHTPDPCLRWWSTDVPISPGVVLSGARIRLMEFDLLMTRSDFLAHLDMFTPHGMIMSQLTRPVPNSLWLQSLPEEQTDRILIQNGMLCRYHLPHRIETAQFSCTDRTHLERVVALPEISAKLLRR